MPDAQPPSAPVPEGPDSAWEHRDLYWRVNEAIYALPPDFRSDLAISGVLATDLHTFNSSLGATIETQVVDALNDLRAVWDPEDEYRLYRFDRQAQTFPDVVLRAASPQAAEPIIMGIELKGWYALAKEGEPSFRYKASPGVCAPQDLLVVFPWALDRVISGSPQVFEPYVAEAAYAARYRNWHWEHHRTTTGERGIVLSTVSHHYPTRADAISDRPAYDAGGNFGRFARTGLMDDYMKRVLDEDLMGIPLHAWQRFLGLFTEETARERVDRELDRMATSIGRRRADMPAETVEAIRARMAEILGFLEA